MTDLVHKSGFRNLVSVVVLEQLPDNPRFDREAREPARRGRLGPNGQDPLQVLLFFLARSQELGHGSGRRIPALQTSRSSRPPELRRTTGIEHADDEQRSIRRCGSTPRERRSTHETPCVGRLLELRRQREVGHRTSSARRCTSNFARKVAPPEPAAQRVAQQLAALREARRAPVSLSSAGSTPGASGSGSMHDSGVHSRWRVERLGRHVEHRLDVVAPLQHHTQAAVVLVARASGHAFYDLPSAA